MTNDGTLAYRFNGIDTVGDQPLADLFRCLNNYDGVDALDEFGDVYPIRETSKLFAHYKVDRNVPEKLLLSFGTSDVIGSRSLAPLQSQYQELFDSLTQSGIEEIYFILPLPLFMTSPTQSQWSRYCSVRMLIIQNADRYPNIHVIDLADLFIECERNSPAEKGYDACNSLDRLRIKSENFAVDLNGFPMIHQHFITRYENALKQRVHKTQELRRKSLRSTCYRST